MYTQCVSLPAVLRPCLEVIKVLCAIMQGDAAQQGELQQQGDPSAAADRQLEVDSDNEDEAQQKGKKGKRDRGKGQHKVPKRQKGNNTGSFFADLL